MPDPYHHPYRTGRFGHGWAVLEPLLPPPLRLGRPLRIVAAPKGRKWVSPSPKSFGAGPDDCVVGGGRDGNRLLDEAMKEQSPSL